MKTLIIFCPENGQNSHGTFKDIIISDKKLRIIYFCERLSPYGLFFFKLKIKKLLKEADILLTDFSKKFSGNKIYRSGNKLAMYHISKLINIVAQNSPITVFSHNSADIYALSDVIMTNKSIKFLTSDSLISEFDDTLLSEFGLSGGSVTQCDLRDETVVIMPGGESFSPEGANKIINLSKSRIPWKSINPENISYTIPPSLKGVPLFLRYGDMLETVLCFLGMDFSYTKPVSVKFNKQNGIF